jgi:hypothetical protein
MKYTDLYQIRTSKILGTFQIVLTILILTSIMSCGTSRRDRRPSPYAADSSFISGSKLNISYSSPSVKNRQIWGELVPFGSPWRTGANEATVFSTSENINVNGKLLKAGKYSLFTIPESHQWTIIFNEDWDQWGAYNYEENKDALRILVIPNPSREYNERMKFSFEDSLLIFKWEKIQFSLEITKE